jgi:hypothetical protein
MELGKRGKGKENDRASVISYGICKTSVIYKTPVKVEDIRMCIARC